MKTGGEPTLAVLGATGAVGSVLRGLLSERRDVWGEIRLLASPRSAGRKLPVRGEEVEVLALDEEALEGVDVALFHLPDDAAAQWAPVAAAKGAVVIDSSAVFRAEDDVPLVVPEINAHAARVRPRGIVASPDCTTLALIVAVGALHSAWGLESLVLSTYQAVSGSGREGVDTLRRQLAEVAGTDLGTKPGDVRRAVTGGGPYPAPIALNVVPFAGAGTPDGWTTDEMAVRAETRKILGMPQLPVSVTCVRVSVVTGHSVAVHARFENEVTVPQAHEILAAAPGVVLCDAPGEGEFPTPADAVGTDPTWAGRVRRALDDPQALEFFVCGDNLRKGAALNSVQIAELVASPG
ncbi:aspartate-semialdehyde dehydrogenase [Streptomyces sp. RKND-216]|uniref:aspartate-semialdehyde dehydrogenase n=1 Tax=Streptomyces sp. RKND-216 TaxID=2562581 RepID=UPI00109DB83B|nr:aspartate-semialdehyde dehydrogenase [Streptomyces sp. RKND-216]THA25274.1 aspartate-semialdehyde dehydrogenase [Streptomyces sp. RKND-216]